MKIPPAQEKTSDSELRAGVAELRAEYRQELPRIQQDLADCVHRARSLPGDAGLLRELRSKSHRIHGTAGSFGFSSISEAVGLIESTLDAIEAGQIPPDQMWIEIDHAVAAVKAAFAAAALGGT